MGKQFNRIRVASATAGTGPLTLNSTGVRSATEGDGLSFQEVGVPNGTVVSYLIREGNKWGYGPAGSYSSGVLTRDAGEISWDGTTRQVAKLSLGGAAIVEVIALAEDFDSYLPKAGGTITGALTVNGLGTFSNNVTIAGTIAAASGGVTGNWTVGSALTAASGNTTGNWTVGGALAAASGSVSGNLTVSGTLTAGTFAPSTISTGSLSATGITCSGNINTSSGGDIGVSSATGGTTSVLYNDGSELNISTNGGYKAKITSGGVLLVGTSSLTGAGLVGGGLVQVNSEIMSVGPNAGVFWASRTATPISNANWFGFFTSGTETYLYNGGANIGSFRNSDGVYTSLSDFNKKKHIDDADVGLAEILALRPVVFRMKTDDDDAPLSLGFIAQDVKDILPYAYYESRSIDPSGKESVFIGLQDRPFIAAMVRGMQEMARDNQQMAARISALESQIGG